MHDSSSHWRSLISEALDLLGSREQQLAYEHAAPNVDITSELISIWFDQVYHPDHDPFSSTFTADELGFLSEFNRVLDEAVDELPDSRGTVHTWLENTLWQGVMQSAQRTLRQIESVRTPDDNATMLGEQSRVTSALPDSDA